MKFGNYSFSFKKTFSNLIFSAYNLKHQKNVTKKINKLNND